MKRTLNFYLCKSNEGNTQMIEVQVTVVFPSRCLLISPEGRDLNIESIFEQSKELGTYILLS